MSCSVLSAGMGGAFSLVFIGTKVLIVDNDANNDTKMIKTDHQRRQNSDTTSSARHNSTMGMKASTINGAGKKFLGSIPPAWAQAIVMMAITATMISNTPKRRFFFLRLFLS